MNVADAQKQILQSLTGLGRAGGMTNVIAVLKGSAKDYQEAFEVANNMQNMDLIKIIYCSFDANIINVELTLKGKEFEKSM